MRKRATRGSLRSSTRPNLDAHETGRARSRSRDSRRGESPEAGSGDETEDGPPYHHPDPRTQRVDSPVRTENKTDQPPPGSGASRRRLSPAPGKRHQLSPPLSTGHHRRHPGSPGSAERHPQGSRDLGAHAGLLDLAYAAARAQRALDDVNLTILRGEARPCQFDGDIEQAKTAAREASLVVERAQQALAQSVASAAAGATAAPSPSTRPQGVASQRPRPGGAAFFKGSVACMAFAPRVEFSPAVATAVVETACALLASERPASWQVDARSVEAAWTRMDCTPYARQTRAAPTLALVKALLIAHDEAPDPVFWPNPGGRVGGTQPGETATQRQSRPRGPQPWGWQQKKVGVTTTTTAAGVTAVVGAGEAHRVLVRLRAPPRGQLWSNNQGKLAAALAEAT